MPEHLNFSIDVLTQVEKQHFISAVENINFKALIDTAPKFTITKMGERVFFEAIISLKRHVRVAYGLLEGKG